MTNYLLKWPPGFDDFSWELESKGWFHGLDVIVGDKIFQPTFYDLERLSQDISEETSNGRIFLIRNLIVIESVTRSEMEKTIADLAISGELGRMIE
jgi:hypothetical protein